MTKTRRVMIVDDEIIVRKGIEALLSDWQTHGYKVVGEAESGNQAMEKIPELHPDIVLTDLFMADGDGFYLISRLKAHYPDIRIVVLSNYNDYENVRRAMKSGAADYIFKLDVKTSELIKVLDEVSQGIQDQDEEQLQDAASGILLALSSGTVPEEGLRLPFDISPGCASLAVQVDDFQILVRKHTFPDWTRTHTLLTGMVEETLHNYSDCLLLSLSPSRLIVLMQRPGSEAPDLQTGITILARRIQRTTGLSLSFSLSRWTDREAEVLAVIKESVSALSSLYFSQAALVTGNGGNTESRRTHEDSDDYMGYLATRDARGALAAFRKELEACRNGGCGSKKETIRQLSRSAGRLALVLDECGIGDTLSSDSISLADAVLFSDRYSSLLSLAESILSAADRAIEGQKPVRREIAAIISYIRENPGRDISVSEAASIAGMSESNFQHVFSEEIGIPFTRFLISQRMEKAAALLLNTDLRIGEVAEKVGMSNQNYFSLQFKKTYGQGPLEFRNAARSAEK